MPKVVRRDERGLHRLKRGPFEALQEGHRPTLSILIGRGSSRWGRVTNSPVWVPSSLIGFGVRSIQYCTVWDFDGRECMGGGLCTNRSTDGGVSIEQLCGVAGVPLVYSLTEKLQIMVTSNKWILLGLL
jgi:hypothetical protein